MSTNYLHVVCGEWLCHRDLPHQKWLSQVWFPPFLQPPKTTGCVHQGPPCLHATPQGLQQTPQYHAVRALVVATQTVYYHRHLKMKTNGNYILGPQEHQHRAKGRPRAKCYTMWMGPAWSSSVGVTLFVQFGFGARFSTLWTQFKSIGVSMDGNSVPRQPGLSRSNE